MCQSLVDKALPIGMRIKLKHNDAPQRKYKVNRKKMTKQTSTWIIIDLNSFFFYINLINWFWDHHFIWYRARFTAGTNCRFFGDWYLMWEMSCGILPFEIVSSRQIPKKKSCYKIGNGITKIKKRKGKEEKEWERESEEPNSIRKFDRIGPKFGV